ncbi:hypothetical protein ACOSP7_013938 [Xanthoceras sorbifolium]
MDCFEKGCFDNKINQTLITLIPKVSNLLSMIQLRPISLYNTMYKVVSKIIVQRLRGMLLSLISPSQVALVPGRQIQDNIIMAQEILQKFKMTKGEKGNFTWKIDLMKAYNKLQ